MATAYGVDYNTIASAAGVTAFEAVVNDCVAKGQSWIRYSAYEGQLLFETLCTATSLSWQSGTLGYLDSMVNYAHSQGMHSYFILPVPLGFTKTTLTTATAAGATSFTLATTANFTVGQSVVFSDTGETLVIAAIAGNTITTTTGAASAHAAGAYVGYTSADYWNVVSLFCGYLAARWAGKVGAWQIGNEENLYDYRAMGRSVTDPTYLSELHQTLVVARKAIRAVDTAPTTLAAGASAWGYLDAPAYGRLQSYFDQMHDAVDILDIHAYNGPYPTFLAAFAGYLTALASRYGMPIIVGEYGEYSYDAGLPTYTEAYQASSIVAQMAAILPGNPLAMLLYSYQELPPTVAVTYGGDYSVAPTGVTFAGGGGAGMTGTVQTGGTSPHYTVTGVTITGPGHDYTSAPTVGFTGGTVGSGPATATVTLNEDFLPILYPDGTPKAAYRAYFLAQPALPALASVTFDALEPAEMVPGGYDSDVLYQARQQQGVLMGTSYWSPAIAATACTAVPWMARNILTNGGFELNSRGGTTFDGTGSPTCPADGWQASYGTYTRQTTTTDGGTGVAIQCTPIANDTAANAPLIIQSIYNWQQYIGRTLSFSVRVYGCYAYLILDWGTGQATSQFTIDCRAGWTTITATATIPAGATQLNAALSAGASPGTLPTPTFYFDNAMLTVSPGPVAYQPDDPALEHAKARARYWTPSVSRTFYAAVAGQVEDIDVPFLDTMLAVPGATVTNANGGGAVSTNVASATVTNLTTMGATIQLTATAAGSVVFTGQTLSLDAGVF